MNLGNQVRLKLWGLCILAACIIHVLLIAMIGLADQPHNTEALEVWFRIALGTVFFWFIFGPLWSLVFFNRAPSKAATEVQ
jgi:cellulose synthase/poly-beta-1,6-N-acetylglucosamine synthase-like glycosyltransferase